ncbi:tripartite tricarboxylate transporter permease [Caldifermentibacillus hisashii]|jgi:putative tricarboxylic transport membrane protein|uniref:tripartite tricarboxylate transporter permease n=1 Tax=Bacillaceae TaxID=186817 RepID=UPI000BA450F5|nr:MULTISPECIES: tripartite tricarboxylate transporter permease [Bacillaceae]MCB7071112.1 tripartite tricarboxylate transporter permease [Caldibacillus sp. 210928-DFI.2.22]MCB7074569.1 tripartite tricarboxylate transporter permease [Caldibacillus sp. 210928-DFI.2.18]PAC35571.1 tripartite tricarboxylate transporter TctA family protein [Caldifermentibacillus hisashii]
MDVNLLIQMLIAAILGTAIYTIIGIVPGTDETAVIAPITLAIVLAGVEPIVVLTFYMAAVIAHKLTDSVPVAVAGIPGGVMATPMVEHALVLKKYGQSETSIKKMMSGSVIGTLVSVPVSLLLASVLVPFAERINEYANPILFAGAVLLALLSTNRWLSLIIIIPFALLIQGLRHLYWDLGIVPENKNVFISFFLGITIGPVIVTLLDLLSKERRKQLIRHHHKEIILKKSAKEKGFPNPFKILTKKEVGMSSIASLFGTITFMFSAVGVTTLVGELFSKQEKEPVKRSSLAISCMEALANATYIAGSLIPLIALGFPLSSVALGPANPLFNAPPVFTLDHNLHHILSFTDFLWAIFIGVGISLFFTYVIIIKYANEICAFVFKWIPHEAILGLFVALVFLLAFMDAGWLNIAGVLLIGIVSGTLSRYGVNFGVQFMVLYSAPWLVSVLAG